MALRELVAAPEFEVRGLLTTLTADFDRVSMHGVRRGLLEAQAAALGLPLRLVEIPAGAGNEEYEARFGEALGALRGEGVGTIAFGDLFLSDVRRYREALAARWAMDPIFPIWGRDTEGVAREFHRAGFRAVLVCVDGQALDPSLAGRDFDPALLAELPAGVDPCGENGEFHTFVHDGPLFAAPVPFTRGELVVRDGRFAFRDLF